MTTKLGDMASSSRSIRHKTLSAYYDHIRPLGQYLVSPSITLSKPDDPVAYTELLQNTLYAVIRRDEVPAPPYSGISGSQQEAIDRILVELGKLSKPGIGRNLLLASNRRQSDLPINTARLVNENRDTTAPATVLRSVPWRILRARIGDAAFRHLLLYNALYTAVGNNCFMQLSGTPLYDVYDSVQGIQPVVKKKRKRDKCKAELRKKRKVGLSEEHAASLGAQRNGKSPADTYIARQRMFYGQPARRATGVLTHGPHPQHILNTLSARSKNTPDESLCFRLLKAIFPKYKITSFLDTRSDRSALKIDQRQRLEGMMGMMRELLVRHNRMDYSHELRQCMARSYDFSVHGLRPLSHSQVCRYTASVLRKLVSTTIPGSEHNLHTLVRHARHFICAKQFEPVNLHAILHGLHINDFAWLGVGNGRVLNSEARVRKDLVGQLVFWLFNDFLIPLLKNTFYITETAQTRYETVYYAHDDWAIATRPHFAGLEDDILEPLDDASNDKAFALREPLGVSAVRLIPKPNGFRPIVNIGRRVGGSGLGGLPTKGTAKAMIANQILRGVHQVLTFEKDRKPHLLGSSLFGTNEIFSPLQDLKIELNRLHGKIPRLYFVKMDIKAAFDTIKQDKMLQVVSDILDKNYDYWLTLYCLLLPPASKASQNTARRMFKTRALVNDGSLSSFGDMARNVAKPLRNAVVIDLLRKKALTREACLELLEKHIKHNVWQVGSKFFRQKEGIPQGSKISSLLCSIMYAALEREHFNFLHNPGSRLIRYIDDFLFITDDHKLAKRFIDTMSVGFPKYGAFISPAKTLTSFEHARGSQVAPVCGLNSHGGCFFPYCGFGIDTATLDISMDTPRMITGPIQQSFALRSARRRGAAIVGWLSRQLENRNHVAYLDTLHNNLSTVHLNIYLNFALTAMKIPHYFSRDVAISPRQAKLIFESISLSVGYTYVAGRARVRHAAREDKKLAHQHFTVRKVEFEFLAKSAVLEILLRKAARFKDVVHLFRQDLSGREYRILSARHKRTIERGWREVNMAKY